MRAGVILMVLLTVTAVSSEFLGVVDGVQPADVLPTLVPVGYTAKGILVVGRDLAALERYNGKVVDKSPQDWVYYRVPLQELLAAPEIAGFATIVY
ncbi:MAG: hypothetical protein ABIK43_06740, partial [candidate division WOR-3 bacterium]